MLFTHFGISGPVALQISLAVVDALDKGPVSVAIDLKPDITHGELRNELQGAFNRFGKRTCRNVLGNLIPEKMVVPLIELAGVSPDKRGHEITAGERDSLVDLIKCLRFDIKCPLSMEAAMVTAGGVSLKEINPSTMASRIVKGLFFCGEVMDIDADTGGYNLQAAFSSGYIAGENAAKF